MNLSDVLRYVGAIIASSPFIIGMTLFIGVIIYTFLPKKLREAVDRFIPNSKQ